MLCLHQATKLELLYIPLEKINVLGSCDLFVVHLDTKCLKKITFQVVNHEGSVIVSCVASLELGLMQIHSVFNKMNPDCG